MRMSGPIYLPGYLKVMKDKLPSQFLISRSISVDFSIDSDIYDLWELHNEAMKSFREEFDRISSMDDLLPIASPSLLDLKVAIADH